MEWGTGSMGAMSEAGLSREWLRDGSMAPDGPRRRARGLSGLHVLPPRPGSLNGVDRHGSGQTLNVGWGISPRQPAGGIRERR